MSSIFEASIFISNVVRGNTTDQLKKFLINFKNMIYTEKGPGGATFKVHFYKISRAKEALSFLQYTPSAFSNCTLVKHLKEVGTQGDVAVDNEAYQGAAQQRPRRRNLSEDSDGFSKVARR